MSDPDDKQKPLDISKEPRLTAATRRRAAKIWIDLSGVLARDEVAPDYRTLRSRIELCRAAVELGQAGTIQHLRLIRSALDIIDEILPAVRTHAPYVAEVYGDSLRGALQGFVLEACGAPRDISRPEIVWDPILLPTNLRAISPEEEMAYYFEKAKLIEAYMPGPGRPKKKASGEQRRKGHSPADPVLADKALAMYRDGKSFLQIGRTLYRNVPDLTDGAAKSRADRLIVWARRREEHKKPSR
jgi:hypothetical protein